MNCTMFEIKVQSTGHSSYFSPHQSQDCSGSNLRKQNSIQNWIRIDTSIIKLSGYIWNYVTSSHFHIFGIPALKVAFDWTKGKGGQNNNGNQFFPDRSNQLSELSQNLNWFFFPLIHSLLFHEHSTKSFHLFMSEVNCNLTHPWLLVNTFGTKLLLNSLQFHAHFLPATMQQNPILIFMIR